MKNISKAALITTLVVGSTLLSSTSASAFEADKDGIRGEMNEEMSEEHRKGGEDRFSLMPDEMKEGFKAEHKEEFENLSEEERTTLREEHREERKANRETHQQEVADFSGVSTDELKEAHQNGTSIGEILTENGKTQEDATTFLTEKANDRVDSMVERHNLATEEETTVRGRITEFVNSILGKWFK